MRFYEQQHQYYCGIDLHARMMYLCFLVQQGYIVLHRTLFKAFSSPGRKKRKLLPAVAALEKGARPTSYICLVQRVCKPNTESIPQ